MDVALCVAAIRAGNARAVGHEVFADVVGAGDESCAHLVGEEESVVAGWIAHADVAEGVKDGEVVEDVVGGDEGGEGGGYVDHVWFSVWGVILGRLTVC